MAERDVLAHLLVIDRELAGRWRRQVQARSVVIDVQPFRSLTRAEIRGVEAAAERYGTFVGLPAATNIV
jgi:Winged helix DNA-binding domain